MKSWRRTFAVIVLLLLPLQGLAAALSVFACIAAADSQQSAGLSVHTYDNWSGDGHHDEINNDRSGHTSCHHAFTGLPAIVTVNLPSELPAFESSLTLLFTLHVPERPQRPPRA
jgi:hypothetical protein